MARILSKDNNATNPKRFQLIMRHYNNIALMDALNDVVYTIECASKNELYTMCLYNDRQWLHWLESNNASKLPIGCTVLDLNSL